MILFSEILEVIIPFYAKFDSAYLFYLFFKLTLLLYFIYFYMLFDFTM